MTALRAVCAERLAKVVVAGTAVRDVSVLTGRSRQFVFQEVADRIVFEEEGLGFLLGSHGKNPEKSS